MIGKQCFHAVIFVGSMLLALICAELITRLVAPQLSPTRIERGEFWEYNELLGWANKPNQRSNFVHPEFNVAIAINSNGLRDDEFDENSTKRRALVLGDSFGWGFGVEHSERFDTLLEGRYSEWDFINASVSGYGTDQQYLWLENEGLKYKPELLLLLLYDNDFANNAAQAQYWYNKPKFDILQNGELHVTNVPVPHANTRQLVKQWIVGRTYLYGYFYRNLITPIEFKWTAYNIKRKTEQGLRLKPKVSAQELTVSILLGMQQLASDNGIEFVLVSVPATGRYTKLLSDFSREHSINYLALDDDFSAADKSEYRIPGDLHWNAFGHKLAASSIEAYLASAGILDAPALQEGMHLK